MTDSSHGMRLMQTFKKLPNASPTTNSAHSKARSKAGCGRPLLRLIKAPYSAAQFHFVWLIRRHLTHPVYELTIDQPCFGRTVLPPVLFLLTNRHPIARYVLSGLLALPIEQSCFQIVGECLIGTEAEKQSCNASVAYAPNVTPGTALFKVAPCSRATFEVSSSERSSITSTSPQDIGRPAC